jgi:hypothetical protein
MASGSPEPAAAVWRQRAGFSVLLDTDEATGRWRTRVYHEESGAEVVLTGRDSPGAGSLVVEITGIRLRTGPGTDDR